LEEGFWHQDWGKASKRKVLHKNDSNLGDMTTNEDIAEMALFLASDRSKFLSLGFPQCVTVDLTA